MTDDIYDSPADLAPPEAETWRRLMADYDLHDASALVLLAQLCRALQLARECRETIHAEGRIVTTPTGRRSAHPLLATWAAADKSAAATLRLLNLESAPARDRPGRPPGLYRS